MKDDDEYPLDILEIAKMSGREPREVAEVRGLSAGEMEALVKEYLYGEYAGEAERRLRAAKDLVAPYLIAALGEQEPFKPLPKAQPSGPKSPGARALVLLDEGVHEAVKLHLLRWVGSDDKKILRAIDSGLAAFGSDDLLPHIKRLFEHEDMFISSGTRCGALVAFKAGRGEPAFRQYVWQHCWELLYHGVRATMYDPIRLLVLMDEEATKGVLLHPAVMRADHPLLAEALGTLNRLKSPPDAEFLYALMVAPNPNPKSVIGQLGLLALQGLVIHQDPRAGASIEKLLAAPEKLASGPLLSVWGMRFRYRGLPAPLEAAWESYEAAGSKLEAVAEGVRLSVLVQWIQVDEEWGFARWFADDFSRYGEETERALEVIGATEHAQVLAEVRRKFGGMGFGPEMSYEEIDEQLREGSEELYDEWRELGERWLALPLPEVKLVEWEWRKLG